MEQFSNGAIWGRHHQLDDSLVGQLTIIGIILFQIRPSLALCSRVAILSTDFYHYHHHSHFNNYINHHKHHLNNHLNHHLNHLNNHLKHHLNHLNNHHNHHQTDLGSLFSCSDPDHWELETTCSLSGRSIGDDYKYI